MASSHYTWPQVFGFLADHKLVVTARSSSIIGSIDKEYRARIDGEDRDSPNMGMKSLTVDQKWGGVFGDYFIYGNTTNEAEIE